MEKILEKTRQEFDKFVQDATVAIMKGNKSAARRARVKSVEIDKLLKEFRDASLGRN